DVNATQSGADVVLSWTAPGRDGNVPITSYRVYRDGQQVGEVNATTWTDPNVPAGAHGWIVRAVNAAGEGDASYQAALRVTSATTQPTPTSATPSTVTGSTPTSPTPGTTTTTPTTPSLSPSESTSPTPATTPRVPFLAAPLAIALVATLALALRRR